jgi:hypothetical protein
VRRVKRLAAILTTLVLASLTAYAADVTGTWHATVDLGG